MIKDKAIGIWSAFKGKAVATWKSGRKGKALGIGIAAMVLLLLTQSVCGGSGDSGRGGTYTGGDLFYECADTENEGCIYKCDGGFTVLQATKKGNLVERYNSDQLIFVVTPGKRYVDGESLQEGYYIRRGFCEYEAVGGAERTVPRYVQVTDKKTLQEIAKIDQEIEATEKARQAAWEAKRKAEQEAREAERKAEEERREAERKAEEEAKRKAAEQGAYELDIPIKSLCGFKLGAPPSQVQDLLQEDDGTPVQDLYTVKNDCEYEYRLAKPFRLFTNVTVVFADRGFGKHLVRVKLWGEIDCEKTTKDSVTAEMKATAELIEKKFGIQFSPYFGAWRWRDENGKESINIALSVNPYALNDCGTPTLTFEARDEVAQFDKRAKEAQKTSIQLDANAGADDL